MSQQQRVSVRRTANFDDDLALLQGPGVTASDAVRHAVRLVGQAQRYADQWAQTHGGRRPSVLSIRTRDLLPVASVSDGAEPGV